MSTFPEIGRAFKQEENECICASDAYVFMFYTTKIGHLPYGPAAVTLDDNNGDRRSECSSTLYITEHYH